MNKKINKKVMKKNNNKKIDFLYILLDPQDDFQGYFSTMDEAISVAESDEMDGGVILKVTEAFALAYPPEPEIESYPLELNEL